MISLHTVLRAGLGLLLSAASLLPSTASAWWNAEWINRNKITVTSPAGAAVSQAPVLVRLHTGNFVFTDAKLDGSDVRLVAADDKTPLPFHIEQWDGTNELAFVWVKLPAAAPGTPVDFFIYSGNPEGVGAEDSKGTWDPAQSAAFHFEAGQPTPMDRTANAVPVASFAAQSTANALIGGGLAFNGQGGLTLSASPALTFSSGFTFSAWIKVDAPQAAALLYRQQQGDAPIEVGLQGLRLYAKAGATVISANADLPTGGWRHVAVAVSDKVVMYVDGVEVGAAPHTAGGSAGNAEIAFAFAGEMDEVQIANQARAAEWIRFAAKTQEAGSQSVVVAQAETSEGSEQSYFAILLGAVTLDGWIVIAILMVMMVVSFFIMFAKTVLLNRTEKANQQFVGAFRKMAGDLTGLHAAVAANAKTGSALSASTLYRLYKVGMDELGGRIKAHAGREGKVTLSPQAINAIKATLDAGLVKESHRLNSQMVLLTIAISGGPFLGLLGTVVGVMITFAAIAAVGDVNVNSIAPGIAAALVATVAGLAVAIPALFGYNYLSSRIKNVTADMQVFADELITRLAEGYAP